MFGEAELRDEEVLLSDEDAADGEVDQLGTAAPEAADESGEDLSARTGSAL